MGTEPLDPVTRQYNEALQASLPGRGIAVVELPRLEAVSYTHLDVYKRQAPAPRLASLAAWAVSSGTRPEAIIRSPPAAEEQAYRWAKVRGPVFASRCV